MKKDSLVDFRSMNFDSPPSLFYMSPFFILFAVVLLKPPRYANARKVLSVSLKPPKLCKNNSYHYLQPL